MPSSDSPSYRADVELTDRIGKHAGRWFQDRVEFWRQQDGSRLLAFEMSDVGRHVVHEVMEGDLDGARSILGEVEDVLADDTLRNRNSVLELLEGMDAELEDVDRSDPKKADYVRAFIERSMGPATRSTSS